MQLRAFDERNPRTGCLAPTPVPVTAVAIYAVINIPTDATMLAIRTRLGVADRALKHAVVVRIRVAGGAHTIRSPMVDGEVGVVKRGVQPGRRRMAGCATSGETCRHMVWIRRRLIVSSVAAVTVRGQRRVVVVHVTVRARYAGMRAGQRERRVVVIEGSGRPGCRTVAYVALLRKTGRHVIRIRRSLKILQVTVHASRAGEVVIAIRVTLSALDSGVRSGQRPSGRGVIEGCGIPTGGVVAHLALLGKPGGGVIRIGGSLVILQVAGRACGVGDVVIPVDVTQSALHIGMRSGERPPGLRVIVRRGTPSYGRVADLALLRNSGGDVIGIRRRLIIPQVASDTSSAGQIEIAIRVALIALQLGVSARQWKSDRVVVEVRWLPRRRAVAFLAVLRKPKSHVIGIARLLVVGQVAAHAGCRGALIFSADVAGRAIEGCMHARERESGDP